jgi:hypothetical protein
MYIVQGSSGNLTVKISDKEAYREMVLLYLNYSMCVLV